MKPVQLSVTPDKYVTIYYAGASGDFNPIHIDEEFATSVGLPGRILHGLWTMAQVARAHTEAAGGPDKLKSLKVEFRGMGLLAGGEIKVHGTVDTIEHGIATVKSEAIQGETKLVKNGLAEVKVA
jgi:acyl dehydratase